MENEQYTAIMNALQNLADKQDAMHGDFREFKGSTTVEIDNLKDDIKSDRFWAKVQTVAVMPIMGVLHHYFGH